MGSLTLAVIAFSGLCFFVYINKKLKAINGLLDKQSLDLYDLSLSFTRTLNTSTEINSKLYLISEELKNIKATDNNYGKIDEIKNNVRAIGMSQSKIELLTKDHSVEFNDISNRIYDLELLIRENKTGIFNLNQKLSDVKDSSEHASIEEVKLLKELKDSVNFTNRTLKTQTENKVSQ
jgi:uncharacterized protein YoxC